MNNAQWASLHNHTDMSLLDGLSKPEKLIEKAINNNIVGLSISDHGNLSNIIKFQKARKKVIDKVKGTELEDKAKSIKLINGCELYIKVSDKVNSHLVVLAKNLAGYKTLIKIASEATRRENTYRKPRLSLEQIANFNVGKNLIAFSGHPGSDLGNVLFSNLKGAYSSKTYDEAKTFIVQEWEKLLHAKLDEYLQVFGRENFFLETQLFDAARMPAQIIITKALRRLSQKTGISCVCTCDSHYVDKQQAEDQRVVLCNALKTTLPQIKKKMAEDDDDIALGGFFLSDKYYLPSADEMANIHTESEIKTSLEISQSIEDYDLFSKPIMPKFECPDNLSSNEYMRQLCREGWKSKLSGLTPEDKQTYLGRIKHELEVLQDADLSDYFLVVQDIMNWIKSQGYFCGPGRGSAAGCLASYLMGITAVDPIVYKLIFERFYNAGRNAPGRISMPDIDCDVQAGYRDKVINYIKDKYGHAKVGQISNFSRLQGRACLKDVFRAHEACDFQTMNEICKFIPDEAAIADQLQEMQEETGEKSIIMWSLENNSKELSEWVFLDKDKNIAGHMGNYFAQAIRLEGTYRQRGIHAAAVVIYPEDITDICPVIYDKDGESTIAFDMHDVEYTGGIKLDILGINIMDKIWGAECAINNEFILEK